MSRRNMYGLMAVVAVAWLLILAESYLFIAVIRPLGPSIHVGGLPSTLTKIVLTAGLGLLWVVIMFALDILYTRLARTPS